MFVYDKEKPISCIVFMGDGTYLSLKHKIRVGISEHFEHMVFEEQDKEYITLFNVLENLNVLKKLITEGQLVSHINSKTDFRATVSVPYEYKYDKLSNQVFKNVLKKNKMNDFEELVGDMYDLFVKH